MSLSFSDEDLVNVFAVKEFPSAPAFRSHQSGKSTVKNPAHRKSSESIKQVIDGFDNSTTDFLFTIKKFQQSDKHLPISNSKQLNSV